MEQWRPQLACSVMALGDMDLDVPKTCLSCGIAYMGKHASKRCKQCSAIKRVTNMHRYELRRKHRKEIAKLS